MKMNQQAYEKLICEDIDWLLNNTQDTLERQHIVQVLRNSVNIYNINYDR